MGLKLELGFVLADSFLTLSLWIFELVAAYRYFFVSSRARKDSRFLRSVLCFLLISDCASTVADCAYVFNALVLHWGDLGFSLITNWATTVWLITYGASGFVFDTFMDYQLWTLSSNSLLCGAGLALGTTTLALTIFLAIYNQTNHSIDIIAGGVVTEAIVTLGFIAGTNVFLTLSLWWYLREGRKVQGLLVSKRSFKQTLVFLAKTGSITALLSLCALAIYCIWPRSRGGSIFLRIVGQAYALTIYYILLDRPKSSARFDLHEGEESSTDSTAVESSLSGIPRPPSPIVFRQADNDSSTLSMSEVPSRDKSKTSEPSTIEFPASLRTYSSSVGQQEAQVPNYHVQRSHSFPGYMSPAASTRPGSLAVAFSA